MKILTTFIQVEFSSGTEIEEAILEAKNLANATGLAVKFEFNSVEIVINPNCKYSAFTIAEMYHVELQRPRRVVA